MQAIFNKSIDGYEHLLDANLHLILALFINYYQTNYKHYNQSLITSKSIYDIFKYVNENYMNIILKELSKWHHLSGSSIRTLFHEYAHMVFKKYVTRLKLSETKRLLLTTDRNLTEIVESAGYSNIHQLYKVFNQYVKMTPAEFKYMHVKVGSNI